MNKSEKLEKIYAEIADKNFSVGVKLHDPRDNTYFVYAGELSYWPLKYDMHFYDDWDESKIHYFDFWCLSPNPEDWEDDNEEQEGEYPYKIIWHPVMIGDVLDWIGTDAIDAEYAWQVNRETERILVEWKLQRKPINDQSDSCVNFVYALLPKKD